MPLTADDRLAIQELAARYNHAIDSGDADAWVDTFTPDGAFEAGGRQHQGHDALRAFAHGFIERMAGSRHWNSNFSIEGEGDRATSRCYLMLTRGREVLSTGQYHDDLRRTADGWRFHSRRAISDG